MATHYIHFSKLTNLRSHATVNAKNALSRDCRCINMQRWNTGCVYLCNRMASGLYALYTWSYGRAQYMAEKLTCDKEDINKLKKYFLRCGFFNIFVTLREINMHCPRHETQAMPAKEVRKQDTNTIYKHKKR